MRSLADSLLFFLFYADAFLLTLFLLRTLAYKGANCLHYIAAFQVSAFWHIRHAHAFFLARYICSLLLSARHLPRVSHLAGQRQFNVYFFFSLSAKAAMRHSRAPKRTTFDFSHCVGGAPMRKRSTLATLAICLALVLVTFAGPNVENNFTRVFFATYFISFANWLIGIFLPVSEHQRIRGVTGFSCMCFCVGNERLQSRIYIFLRDNAAQQFDASICRRPFVRLNICNLLSRCHLRVCKRE